MSLIPVAAPLIRRAVDDDNYAQDLREAVAADERLFHDLVYSTVREVDLGRLTPSQWQWFARWRQSLGGELDQVVLFHLARSAVTRFARFEVRALVLRDPYTNELATEASYHPNEIGDVGLRWLAAEADTTQLPLELMRDALQCATEASWFALRQLTALNDERGRLVRAGLDDFSAGREIDPAIKRRWRFA
jgi:hypothetical protein